VADDDEKQRKYEKPKKRSPLKEPKRRGRKGFIVKLAVVGILAVLSLWMGMHSQTEGKGPWDWDAAAWGRFLTFAQKEVDTAKNNAVKAVKEFDWDTFKQKLTQETDKIEKRLAELRSKRKAAPKKTGEADGTPAAIPPSKPTEFELGLQELQEGNKHLRKAKDSEPERKQAEAKFRAAEKHFATAFEQAKTDSEKNEIDGYRARCGTRLNDCARMGKLHR